MVVELNPIRQLANGNKVLAVANDDGTEIGSEAVTAGLAITGQTLEAGGDGNLGWLSSVRKSITDRLVAYVAGGAAVASPTGLALMHFDASNVPRQVNATNPLAVQQAALDEDQDAVRATMLGALTNRSGTITTGGTAQQVMAANALRRYLLVQNVSDTDCWVNLTTTAVATQPSILLKASGGSLVMEGSFVSNEVVSIIGATTGKAFTAKEG